VVELTFVVVRMYRHCSEYCCCFVLLADGSSSGQVAEVRSQLQTQLPQVRTRECWRHYVIEDRVMEGSSCQCFGWMTGKASGKTCDTCNLRGPTLWWLFGFVVTALYRLTTSYSPLSPVNSWVTVHKCTVLVCYQAISASYPQRCGNWVPAKLQSCAAAV